MVERARAGESEAFRVIFERHAPAVRRFLGDLLRDAPAADEVLAGGYKGDVLR